MKAHFMHLLIASSGSASVQIYGIKVLFRTTQYTAVKSSNLTPIKPVKEIHNENLNSKTKGIGIHIGMNLIDNVKFESKKYINPHIGLTNYLLLLKKIVQYRFVLTLSHCQLLASNCSCCKYDVMRIRSNPIYVL